MENNIENNYNLYDLNVYVENINKIHIYNEIDKDIQNILIFKDDSYFLHFNNIIEKNPLITLMLLKSSNNPLFELDKINNLSLAFKIFGLESLRGFLLEYHLDNKDFRIFLELIYKKDINHLIFISKVRKDFISILLKKLFKLEKSYLESTRFILDLGLLYTSDIIYELDTNNKNLSSKVEEFYSSYETLIVSEEILLNFNNYTLFSKLLKKWNFPPIIYELIKNIPLDEISLDEENKDLLNNDFIYDINLLKVINKIINFEKGIAKEDELSEYLNELKQSNLNIDLIKEILEELKPI